MYIHSIKHKPAIQKYIQKNNPHKKSGISMTSSIFHPMLTWSTCTFFFQRHLPQKNHSLKQVPDSLSQRWTHCYLRQRGQFFADDSFDEKLCFGGDELVEKGLKKGRNQKRRCESMSQVSCSICSYLSIICTNHAGKGVWDLSAIKVNCSPTNGRFRNRIIDDNRKSSQQICCLRQPEGYMSTLRAVKN